MELHRQSCYTPSFRARGKFTFFYILYLVAITVITYLNINRLVFIMENVVFSARQKMGFHNFTTENLCLKTLKDRCLGFTRREESNLLASKFSQQIGFWGKDLHIGGERYE